MESLLKKERKLPCKPEWRIILDHLVFQDMTKLYRICRKMIIYLDRKKIPEISKLIGKLNPTVNSQKEIQSFGQNWPKPKGHPFVAKELIEKVFDIADKYISDDEITKLMTEWVNQENFGFLSATLEKRHAPLIEVVDAVKKFMSMVESPNVLSLNERVGLRVALILRFLSESLNYINIAKHYVTIEAMAEVIDRIIGAAQGNGKLGGKSAGLILACQIISKKKSTNPLLANVQKPKSLFLTSDGIFEFIHYNALEEFVFSKYLSTEEIKQEFSFLEYIFKNSHFPPESIYDFNVIIDDFAGKPIVVRSSSLLEDSFEASFSGKYKSLFLANVGTREERLASLINAVAEVYASTFAPDPIEYRKERGLLDFREEMGILIQEVVGNKIGKYFLPSFAGVAFSINEFRWSPRIKREDGIVRLVAGLGTRAVDRTINDYPKLISPGQPGLKVNTSIEDSVRYSQQFIDVINLESNKFETIEFSKLIQECKGNYPGLNKIVSFNRASMLAEPISIFDDFLSEDLVITFNNLIDKTDFVKQVKAILHELQEAFQFPIDVEFASDGENIYLLQCRPQSQYSKQSKIRVPKNINPEKVLFTANQFVNNGLVEGIEYIVYVDSIGYSSLKSSEELLETGRIISKLNSVLPRRKFILIGPGRWGSKGDIKLGVPVIYSDINNTAMLIEVAREKEGYIPELSFGTHFFQDLVEANIKYLPLYPDKQGNIFKEDFFLTSENELYEILKEYKEFENVIKVVKIDKNNPNLKLSIYMDGESNEAAGLIC